MDASKFIGIVFLLAVSSIALSAPTKSCSERSVELQEIVKEDQAIRSPEGFKRGIDPDNINRQDAARRKRVEEIYKEGCFKTPQDYAAAALVFQHGNLPKHYLQTFDWAKKAVELGDKNSKWLMAASLDRYLVHTGHKQLFATQAERKDGSDCTCLNQVESDFPEKLRLEYTKKTLDQQFKWIEDLNKNAPTCKGTKFCKFRVKSSPIGSFPRKLIAEPQAEQRQDSKFIKGAG